MKAVFERLPQYELELVQVSDLSAVITGVNSGLYQLGFNNLAKNEEREKMVQYTDPIMANEYLVVLNKDLGIEDRAERKITVSIKRRTNFQKMARGF